MLSHRLKISWALCWGLPLVWLLCQAEPGAAAGPPPTGDPCLADPSCSELVSSARALSKTQQHAEALSAYQAAYARHPVPWLLLNMGRMQHKLSRYDEAISSYRAFLQQDLSGTNAELRQRAEEYLRAAESERAQLTSSPPAKPLDPPGPTTAQKPIYKKWWFWTAVGVVTVGVALGAGLGAYASRPNLTGVTVLEPFK
jgi:tetratricopeptide (TPR) repeat protein